VILSVPYHGTWCIVLPGCCFACQVELGIFHDLVSASGHSHVTELGVLDDWHVHSLDDAVVVTGYFYGSFASLLSSRPRTSDVASFAFRRFAMMGLPT